jgi:hypothetical protein
MASIYGAIAACLLGCAEFIETPPLYIACVGVCTSIYGDPPYDPADEIRKAHQGNPSMHRPDVKALTSHHAAISPVPE